MRLPRILILFLFGAGLLLCPTDLSSCGPFLPAAVFTYSNAPYPLETYKSGQLGILLPTYPRTYLWIAYRYLTEVGLTTPELEAVFPPPVVNPPDSTKIWLDARAKAPGVAPAPKINVYRPTPSQTYMMYLNCPADAFQTAAQTLAARMAQFGPASSFVNNWVHAQDQVFANCGGPKPEIPAPLPASSSALAQADRNYQIAAATFYAEEWGRAADLFRGIAADASSPWSTIAAYLVARAEIRDNRLAEAEAQLRQILQDPNRSAVHSAARRMLGYVRWRLYPEQRLKELGDAIVGHMPPQQLAQDVTDYRLLLDKLLMGPPATPIPRREDLTDWLLTFQARGGTAASHAVERWRATGSLPWLVAALALGKAGNSAVPDLVEAAGRVPPDSPAYLTVAFHSVRLLIDAGRTEEARTRLDQILRQTTPNVPQSARNLFLAERMKLSRNFDEFARYSLRAPAGFGYEYFPDITPDADVIEKAPQSTIDADAGLIWNEQIPLELLVTASTSQTLPVFLRREIVMAAWVRAVMLERDSVAAKLVPVLARLIPELRSDLEGFRAARDRESRRFAAIYLMLRHPGMRPYIDIGVGRLTAMDRIDNFRDNWWCMKDESYKLAIRGPLKMVYANDRPAAGFLSSEQQTRAEEEWKLLSANPTAPNYLAAQAVEWARKHPRDPRVPVALALSVRATRYGCTDSSTGEFSKAAFTLLHERYPNSEWARKTPYWFR